MLDAGVAEKGWQSASHSSTLLLRPPTTLFGQTARAYDLFLSTRPDCYRGGNRACVVRDTST